MPFLPPLFFWFRVREPEGSLFLRIHCNEKIILLLLIAFGIIAHLYSAEITGRVVGITDGDTVTVIEQDQGKINRFTVRLYGIDAPENSRSSGQKRGNIFPNSFLTNTSGFTSGKSTVTGGLSGEFTTGKKKSMFR